MAAMGLMKLVGYRLDYVEECGSQKARAVNLVFHSGINSVVKINVYVGGPSGGNVESMVPVRKISLRKHQRIVLDGGGRKTRHMKEGHSQPID